MRIKFIHETAKTPTLGTEGAAGYDLYACIPAIVPIRPRQRVLVPTGIALEIPRGLYGRIAPRSGLAWKKGLDVMAGVIDSDYRGEINVLLINLGEDPVYVQSGDRIAQIIFEMYAQASFETVAFFDATTRDNGGFGSTGIK
jgi:dUTP pyrophosphatase